MVRQEDVDNLFAKPGTVRRHCLLLSACIVFDVTVYPLMIWFLFIDVPAFLQAPPREEDERMFLFIKLGAVCGFTFVVCMYQVILFDLFGQHCSRMRQALSMERKPVPQTRVDDAASKHFEAWDVRPDDAASLAGPPEDSVMALPGALYPQHLGMPSIEEAPDGTVVQMVAPFQSRTMSRNPPGMAGDERGRAHAVASRKYHSEGGDTAARALHSFVPEGGADALQGTLDGRCYVCSSSPGIVGLVSASCGHLVCNSCIVTTKKGSTCLSCKAAAGKSNEKTVSFDRETVFTYIKQTPVQTPR
ncbi:unnamed protein product [Symbiodinium pilosum]|uniref:RING-type domain-containing protein n=1 Tax=Symbiodinium pilosum TaxID=2952 RepID=A0A812W0P9_SYMPI|nr:unnamed protein product [Symbiodinium pilosum]